MVKQDTGMQELNKSVQQIVKLLSIGVSPADAKRIADMESETAKQEKDNVEKKKSQQSKDGKFWSDNIKTWTQLGKFMTKGTKAWFAKQMKATGLLGSTLRMGANIWSNLNTHIIQNLRNAFSSITSHVKEVLGPVYEAFESIKNVFTGVFKFFKGTIMGIGAKVKPEDKWRNKLLQKILKVNKDQWSYIVGGKKGSFVDKLQGKEKLKGWGKFLLVLGVILAAALGAAVRKFILPFEIMGKMISKSFIGKTFMTLVRFFARIGKAIKGLFGKSTIVTKVIGVMRKVFGFFGKLLKPFAKIFGVIGKVFGYIGKAFKWVAGIVKTVIGFFKTLAPATGILAKLGRAFMAGFKVLGWPLTIVIGIYDFIRGFIDTEGTLWDKIKGGFQAALMGFIEMPIRFISWLIEKVAGFFGIEITGLADGILGWISKGFNKLLDLVLNLPLISFLVGFFGTEGTFMEKLKGGFNNMVKGLITLFATIWNWIVDLAYKLLPDWIANKIGLKKMEVPGQSVSTGGSTSDEESKNKEAQSAARKKEKEDMIKRMDEQEKLAKSQLDATKAAGASAAAMGGQGGQGGQGGGDIPQIPDEVDNWGITSRNYDMEMS